MDLIMFGMQGAGKGTVGKLIAEKYGMVIFETGQALRDLAAQDTELGKKVKDIINFGNLVPNEVVMEIVENFMSNLTPGKNVLFDGIPRKLEQALSLNALLERLGRPYKAVFLEISEDTAIYRVMKRKICSKCKTVFPTNYSEDKCFKCGGSLVKREDDKEEAIKTRIETFKRETIPAIEIYDDYLIRVDGEPSIEEVAEKAYIILDPIFKEV